MTHHITQSQPSTEVRRQQNATRDLIYFALIVAGTIAMTAYVLFFVGDNLVRELDVHDVCAQWGCQ